MRYIWTEHTGNRLFISTKIALIKFSAMISTIKAIRSKIYAQIASKIAIKFFFSMILMIKAIKLEIYA